MVACACMVIPSVVVNVVDAVAVGNIRHSRMVVVAAVVVDNIVAYFHFVHLVLSPMNTKEEDIDYYLHIFITHYSDCHL